MSRLFAAFYLRLAPTLVYMLQSSEYDAPEFLGWFWRVRDFRTVMRRGKLDPTAKARLLRNLGWCLHAALGILAAIMLNLAVDQPVWFLAAAIVVLAAPAILAYSLVAVLWVGKVTIQNRQERAIIQRAAAKLAGHTGVRIAIAGSYGKTTMKEILRAVLAEGNKVAATPGNMNTPIGISRFIAKLQGDEEVLIFELGEYYPGDIAELCELVKPDMGVITGINEAHLSKFKTLERTTGTIFELADYLGAKPVYKNGDNPLTVKRAGQSDPLLYTAHGVNGWKVSAVKVGLKGTSFTAKKGGAHIDVRSKLLGRHQIGPLVAAIDLADRLGLTATQIAAGAAATIPFEHRMQPREAGGAVIIDDTYNGNRDGVLAGLDWLRSVEAKRRIYITPGLVEQGELSRAIHEELGREIGAVADVVVLMRNSATPYLEAGLNAVGFKGELIVVEDPLKFYNNLDQFVAAGDVALMQNDWTDNYA